MLQFSDNLAGNVRTAAPRLLIGAIAAAGVLAAAAPGHAQGRLEARYEASLAGVVVGKGGWTIEISDDQYTLSANGGSAGLLKLASSGKGVSATQGKIVNGQLVPAAYQVLYTTDKKHETIKMLLSQGSIKEFSIEPEPQLAPDRLPVTEAHKRNVVDPMTGSLVRVGGTTDPVNQDACRNTMSVFDGRMRYDLQLDYKRMEMVTSEKGYRGAVVVCSVYFVPISGYVPDRAAIKYLASQRNMEVWLAPIAGTRVLAPFKVTVPTPFGTAALEATQFVSIPMPSRAAAKTQ